MYLKYDWLYYPKGIALLVCEVIVDRSIVVPEIALFMDGLTKNRYAVNDRWGNEVGELLIPPPFMNLENPFRLDKENRNSELRINLF